MSMRSTMKWALVLGGLTSSMAFAGWTGQGEQSATFLATGPAGFKIEGQVKKVDIKDDGKNITFAINMNELDTGIGLRNKHMLEDLEAEKHPNTNLVVALDSIKVPEDGKTVETEGKGQWTMHSKTKEMPFKYKTTCKSGVCDVEAETTLSLKDFDIKIRSYMGITVKNDVPVKVKLQLKK